MKIPCKNCITFAICQTKVLPLIYPIRVITFKEQLSMFCQECSILQKFIEGGRAKKPNPAFIAIVDFYLQISKKKENTE